MPAIVNTDQGAQFTRAAFTGLVYQHSIWLSMDGRTFWRGNIVVEPLRRTLKYEEVYLRACDSVPAAQEGIGRYLTLYTTPRPHSRLANHTPEAYFLPLSHAAGSLAPLTDSAISRR